MTQLVTQAEFLRARNEHTDSVFPFFRDVYQLCLKNVTFLKRINEDESHSHLYHDSLANYIPLLESIRHYHNLTHNLCKRRVDEIVNHIKSSTDVREAIKIFALLTAFDTVYGPYSNLIYGYLKEQDFKDGVLLPKAESFLEDSIQAQGLELQKPYQAEDFAWLRARLDHYVGTKELGTDIPNIVFQKLPQDMWDRLDKRKNQLRMGKHKKDRW